MTDYNPITDTQVDPDAPLTSQLGYQLRDNPIAGFEGATGSPYTAAGWHPYDGVLVGDSGDGVIYDHAADGAVTTVTSPNFIDGFEYQFRFDNISAANPADMNVGWYLETAAGYSTDYAVASWVSDTNRLFGTITAHSPRAVANAFMFSSDGVMVPFVNQVVARAAGSSDILPGAVIRTTAQKILNLRLTISGASTFDSGKITMFKRRCFVA